MAIKLRLVFSITIAFLSFYGFAQNKYWQKETTQKYVDQRLSERFNIEKAAVFSLEEETLMKELKTLTTTKKNQKVVYFPNEEGKAMAFAVQESPVFSPELSAKYPAIKSYVGYGLNNEAQRIRFSVSHKGIQSMIIDAESEGHIFMQKVKKGKYVVYGKKLERNTNFICETKSLAAKEIGSSTLKLVDGQVLRKFRLAISTSGEYTNYHGGTVADALAAINATVTRINEVFETDLAVTLELIAETDQVIFTDAQTDPYDGNLNSQVQNTLTSTIGAVNYDIGHLFHRVESASQNGGNAGFIGAVCIDNRKGSAYAAAKDPEGDVFDLDFVAHEMGHQFGANHTWSFESEGTQVQVEPASGTTIMGYAGIVGSNNVASNGDDYFHYYSIFQIIDYLETVSCGETIGLTNTPPSITATGDFVIPKSTAFVLTANATDADVSDVLTYTWEQIDDGVVTQSTFGPSNPGGANFRSQKPSLDPSRYFPSLSSVLTGNLTQTSPPINSAWETVSNVEREMNFALTVRDNALGGGQVASDLVNVLVINDAGPFRVISQSTAETFSAGSTQTVVWDVANTYKAPISATTVDILLSTDGGLTYPTILAQNVSNDGSHKVLLPANPTMNARIMVKATNNIFFAVNAVDFSIEESEVVLNFSELEYNVCQPNDLTVNFDYETYLGFDEETTFTAVSVPSGLGVAISPMTTSIDADVTIDFTNSGGLAEGTYPITILASSASVSKEVNLDINVYDSNFPDVVLSSPSDGTIDVSTNVTLDWEDNPTYTSFDVEIATDLAFTNIIESASTISNAYDPSNLDNEVMYYWRVKPKNACVEGTFSPPFEFTTVQFSCTNQTAKNLPLEISSLGTPKIASKVTFFEDLLVDDINVNLELDHTFLADLVISLTSPSGTEVVLVSSSCGDLRNINATFDDDASSFICSGNPAISGAVKPLGSLGTFEGESILGEWVLQVSDNANSDGGLLKSFSLDICIEGEFRPDEDNDGIFDDGDDLCLDTPEGTEVDSSGCPVYRFPNNNFSVALQSTTCRNNSDGAIQIMTELPLDYTITFTGNGVNNTDNFNSNYTLDNLLSGTYDICIGGTDGMFEYEEHCFTVVISEPLPLTVNAKTSNDGKTAILSLEGADIYFIEFNDQLIQTRESEITLDLKAGNNNLKVSTGLICQGVYEEQFFLSDRPMAYPNPFEDFTTLFLGAAMENVRIAIYTTDGRLVQNKRYKVDGNKVELDFSTLPSGTYFVKFQAPNLKGATKVIRR